MDNYPIEICRNDPQYPHTHNRVYVVDTATGSEGGFPNIELAWNFYVQTYKGREVRMMIFPTI